MSSPSDEPPAFDWSAWAVRTRAEQAAADDQIELDLQRLQEEWALRRYQTDDEFHNRCNAVTRGIVAIAASNNVELAGLDTREMIDVTLPTTIIKLAFNDYFEELFQEQHLSSPMRKGPARPWRTDPFVRPPGK